MKHFGTVLLILIPINEKQCKLTRVSTGILIFLFFFFAYWFFFSFFFIFFWSNRCFLSFSTERGRLWVKGIVPTVFNLCSIDEGFYNSPGCVISSRPHSRELECMVHWGKGARVWAECLAGLPWPWIKHHKARRGGQPWKSQPVIVKEKKSKRIEIIKLGTISSGISTVTAAKARPVDRSLSKWADTKRSSKAVFRLNCLRTWIGNEITTGWIQAWRSLSHIV